MQTKKGFILIYTILVGIVCLTIMMYIFDVQLSEVQYSTSNKKYVLKDDNYQRDKEYLMTLFYTYINANRVQIKEKEINKFFTNSLSSIVEYGGAKVVHFNSTNEFDFITSFDTLNNRHDYFNLEDSDGKFHLIYIRTKYLKK